MHVLLVDDEVELVSALAERLELRGISSDWASTAKEALALAEEHTYDIAVLDIRMPKVGGVELKARLQAQDPQMKFIFLTGYGSEQDFNRISDCIGDECYLVKPVDIQILIQRMHEELETQEGKNGSHH